MSFRRKEKKEKNLQELIAQFMIKKQDGQSTISLMLLNSPPKTLVGIVLMYWFCQPQQPIFNQANLQPSRNIFNLAEKNLKQNPSISKVIIMEHPPRFDTPDMNPTSLKPNLAKLANATQWPVA